MSTLEICIKYSNVNTKTVVDLLNPKSKIREVVGQARIPIWLPDTPLRGWVYAINYTWQLRIILLPWKKQTKLCKRGALSEATVLRLVINHIWRNIKGKGGNWLQHWEVRVSTDITHHWHQAEPASSLMWQRLIFTSLEADSFAAPCGS